MTTVPSTSAAHAAYASRVARAGAHVPWWTAVVITAGSARQAEHYREEIRRRQEGGRLPRGVVYLVVPDLDDQRIGSGGATLNALRALAETTLETAESLEAWWATQRVFVIHAGGDSRRLPQYSRSGKLFSALPVTTPWGEVSSVFDELLARSTAWAERLDAGLVVASGDVILTFDAADLRWDRPGVAGVAMREPMAVGSRHGVYVADEQGRVYAFLQKPTEAQVRAAGGLLEGGAVALDTGLLRFDAPTAARLTALAGVERTPDGWHIGPGLLARTGGDLPTIDLYEHVTLALTGQWSPPADADPAWHRLADALRGVPFWCDLVQGAFTHVGTTRLFRQVMTGASDLAQFYDAHRRLDTAASPGIRSTGVVVDSVLAPGSHLSAGALAIACDLAVPVRAEAGAILHGLSGLPAPVEVPSDMVVHQVAVALPDGTRGAVIRVYGVEDDPKVTVTAGATWLGRPMLEMLDALGYDPALVWPDVPADERTLWNAHLFPLGAVADAWAAARGMLGTGPALAPDAWARAMRLSLADSAHWADPQAIAEAHARRLRATWQQTAVALAAAGSDIRPLLAAPPGLDALAATGRELLTSALACAGTLPTEAASRYLHASRLLGHAGLVSEAEAARDAAFACVRQAVALGVGEAPFAAGATGWRRDAVTIAAPARIDLGGGWSDTPPFCLDWGGTVLNIAVGIGGRLPITARLRRLDEPVIRCVAETGAETILRTRDDVCAPPAPGCPFAIARVALQLSGLLADGRPLAEVLRALGGGLEIRAGVHLPMGSGLGASSILGAAIVRGLAGMLGIDLDAAALSDQVLRLEQTMTTGGGWQDQAGGIFPGAKLVTSGPGLRQRLRVQPLGLTAERQAAFAARFVLYDTGIRRVARDLLAQVVSRYLARETHTVQALHAIKTLALEMAHAMREGAWDDLGHLMQRHWQLNLTLDPHTTNAPITAILREVEPFLAGAKLAGAGGGGFMLLLARDPDAAQAMRARLSRGDLGGTVHDLDIRDEGLRAE